VALVLDAWPGAAPECPGWLETEPEAPVACPAARAGAGVAVEVALWLADRVCVAVPLEADARVGIGAEPPRCCIVRAAGDTAGDGVCR
jgi:hypothetical protein